MQEGGLYMLGLADKYLPGSVASALRSADIAVSEQMEKVRPPTGFREMIDKPKTTPGKVAEFAADIAMPLGVVKKGKQAKEAMTKLPELMKPSERIAGELAGKEGVIRPERISEALGTKDARRAIPGFNWRFPRMNKYGVKNADEAAKTAGEMYDTIPHMRGFQAELSVTARNPRTGMSYGDTMEDMLIGVDELLVPANLRKLLVPGAGPYTVANRYKAARALRRKIDSTSDYAQKKTLRDLLRLVTDLKPVKGQKSQALETIKEADKLYTEASRLRDVDNMMIEASKKGTAYTEGVIQGVPRVKASEVLKRFDEAGDERMFQLFGENYVNVRDALRQLGQSELKPDDLQKLGIIKGVMQKTRQFAGGLVGDWRMLSFLFPGKIVGSAPYHAAKALKKTAQ
jgi:hypothetical protein